MCLCRAIPDGVVREHDAGNDDDAVPVLRAHDAAAVDDDDVGTLIGFAKEATLFGSGHGPDSRLAAEKSGQFWVRTPSAVSGTPRSPLAARFLDDSDSDDAAKVTPPMSGVLGAP